MRFSTVIQPQQHFLKRSEPMIQWRANINIPSFIQIKEQLVAQINQNQHNVKIYKITSWLAIITLLSRTRHILIVNQDLCALWACVHLNNHNRRDDVYVSSQWITKQNKSRKQYAFQFLIYSFCKISSKW